MSDLLRVACVQMTSGPEKAANLEKAEKLVARAAATGADVVVLPEKWNAIGEAETLHAAAEPLEGGESVTAMATWARTHGITLVGGSIVGLQQFGFGLATAILIDVTIVRALLVPSAMKLFGRWNWWLPPNVARIFRVKPSPLRRPDPVPSPGGR